MEPRGHFVSLDDAHTGRTILLTGLQRTDLVDLTTIDDALTDGWNRGWHAFAWLPYSLGEAHLGIRGGASGAVYWFLDRGEADLAADLQHRGTGWLVDTRHDIDEAQFAARIADVHEAISAGATYQVNFTHRITGRLVGSPEGLYRRLLERQAVSYATLAHLPGPAAPWTMSLSPELFLRVDDGIVTTQPMKGTAPATTDPVELSSDPKNRAENLMIVDLLRNDLNRVAVPGTVDVPALFEVERVGQLWQMTSTVRAELRPGTTPGQLLAATFPCGSITGAPKLAAMELIRDLERDPRGLYTGSLGLLEPDDGPLGWRATLSIAIRTLEIDTPDAPGHSARLGIGSGVVADSTAGAEWAECRAKAAFARGAGPTVDLIETMRVIDSAAPLAARHQARVTRSAAALGFAPVDGVVARAVEDTPPGAWRVRLQVAPGGAVEVTRSPLGEMAGPVTLRLAPQPWEPQALGRHKTTDRAHLDETHRDAAALGAFDAVGYDAHGRVLEGTRTSVFARIDGLWLTPPLSLGILDGVQRAEVLATPALLGTDDITEEAFTVTDLLRADVVAVTNAVRGVLAATLEDTL